ncbi:MAG: phosphoenolpyruvate carboxykinase [Hyphomicrobiales bacterium]|nr:phosphoenolpyruvate carboxykinase [Hyphomicrobiales bacterium]
MAIYFFLNVGLARLNQPTQNEERSVLKLASEAFDVKPFIDSALGRADQTEAELLEASVARGEGRLTATGALSVETGAHTGRSAADKFIVRDAATDAAVWWDNNKPMAPAAFEALLADMAAYAGGRALFSQSLLAGADPAHRINVRVICEYAWHALFIRHLLIKPAAEMLAAFRPGLTIIDLPGFKADPARHGCRSETVIACDLTRGLVLIGGTSYAGEIKKSVFSYLNYTLPAKGVMPMHCSINDGEHGPAVFFGLSGTGKTTLSADPSRTLIGDDEHGWSADGLFNFEGGCYAKTIRLSPEAEPQIYAAVNRFGAVLENVPLDARRRPDFDDASRTENTRGAYPLEFIPGASREGRAGHPRHIVMLTADAFGVLPPIARLSAEDAMRHFLCGYTAKVAGTEKGVSEPQATFSACFGGPFMPRPPAAYGALLRDLIDRHGVACWLLNTGWTGGRYGEGRRMPLAMTRALLAAALNGDLADAPMRRDPVFGFAVPTACPGVEATILDPRETWADKSAYDAQAASLLAMFEETFKRLDSSAPQTRLAAE